MRRFHYQFEVRASLQAVADFHRDTRALRRLTPPPIFVQFHYLEPLAEGSIAEFTLWFGPFPVRWRAVHTQVDEQRGFTDTQVVGPLRFWRHRHFFKSLDAQRTLIREEIEYEYPSGIDGWWTQVVYSPLALRFLFLYRSLITRWNLERDGPSQ
ncbi:MAG: hypothetical protein N2646_02415 [Bellilinea sp.]|nr:hypothetical protein [Bellilinea sp.]